MTLDTRRAPSTAILFASAITLAGALLSGCSAASDSAPNRSGSGASEPTPSESGSSPSASPLASAATADFPGCDDVKAALGSAVAGLVELDDSENGVTAGSEGPSLGCAWYTTETASSSTQLDEYGFISIGVSRDPEYTEDSMELLGWTVDDPVVSGEGAWALKVGGGYVADEQLDATGVQVVRDGVVVVLTAGGVALQDVEQLESLTNEWALRAGVAVLGLMD